MIRLTVERRYAGHAANIWYQNNVPYKEEIISCGWVFYSFPAMDLIKAYDLAMMAIPLDENGNFYDLDRLTRMVPRMGVS